MSFLAVTSLLLSAAPVVDARFVMELAGVPVAELHVVSDGQRYEYQSTHFFEEDPARALELQVDDGPWEVLTLLHRPGPGCRAVREEKSRRLEQLCVDARGTLTLDGARLTARYGDDGTLERLEVDSARWTRVTGPVAVPVENPFVRGVSIEAGANAFDPALPGATWLSRAPRGIGTGLERERCLVLARRAVDGHPTRSVVVGLVLEGTRAFPHAWVLENGVHLDPSVPPGDPVLRERRYVALPPARRGVVLLELFEGARTLVRR